MEIVLAEVLPVGNNACGPLPTLAHNGTNYVIAEPGTEWELRVNIINSKKNQRYKVWVKLDGKDIGCTKASRCESSRRGFSVMFRGFHHTNPHTGNRSQKAFKFGALKPAAHAAIVEHLEQIQAGRIEVTCAAVVRTGSKQKRDTEDAKGATDAANKKLPEGKKWFLQPGLQTEEGAVRQTKSGSDENTYAQMYPLPVLRMRYDTADNLRLRKILDPSKPQHAAILARASNTGVARSSSSSSSGSRQTKQEHRAAGVKRERSSSDQRQATAGGADAAVPRSATVETINLADEAPAPLRVGGRALAADELAVCDLAGSDDEGGPVWCVQKKQAIELAV